MADTTCRLWRIDERDDPDNEGKVVFRAYYDCDFAPGEINNVVIPNRTDIDLEHIAGAIPTEDDITWV